MTTLRAISLASFLSLLALTTAHADSLKPECDSTAILIDWGYVATTVYADGSGQGGGAQTGGEYFQYYVGGKKVLVIDPGTITLSGPALDLLSTSELFDRITTAFVIKLVEDSVIPSSGDCGSPTMTSVFIPTCVFRTGSGSGTLLTSVDQCQQSIREVKHCLVSGVASASITSTGNCQECEYGETTCGGGGVGLQ